MRVISGRYKGRTIQKPQGEVRPTTDLVKGSLFSILTSRGLLDGANFLDLFCGTGAIGIEALSRGANSCVFVDTNTSNVDKNLKNIGITSRTIRGDFRKALRLLKGNKFDVIFCDPPYANGYADVALELILKYDIITADGVIIVEHSSENNLINIPKNCIIDRRVFGVTTLEIIMRGNNESDNCGSV